MKNVARKLAIVTGTVAVSIGLLGASAGTADAAKPTPSKKIVKTVIHKDSSWPC